MINTTNLNEARKQAEKLKKEGKPIAVLSQDDEFNRKALEIKGLNMLVMNENIEYKDYMKQRSSGLNEVLVKICADKNIAIGVQIDEIAKKEGIDKAKSLARLAQNIMLLKKAGAKLVLVSEDKQVDKRAISSVLLSLGASTKQAKEASSIFK